VASRPRPTLLDREALLFAPARADTWLHFWLAGQGRVMIQSIAIFVAGVMIAAAILLTNHWSVIQGDYATGRMLLLNRWTGSFGFCTTDTRSPVELAPGKLRCLWTD
jgi:hypothetical protein